MVVDGVAVVNPVSALVGPPGVTGGVPIIPVGGVVPTVAPVPPPSAGALDRVLNAAAGEGGAATAVPLGGGGGSVKRQRCRDFDEKGYCMRGETCPWDHGADPLVLEGLNNPAMIAQIRGPIAAEYSPDAPALWNKHPNVQQGPPGMGGGGVCGGVATGIRPALAQRLGGGGFGPRGGPGPGGMGVQFRGVSPGFPMQGGGGFAGNPIGATPLQRELISVPVVDANKGGDVSADHRSNRFEPEDAVAIADAGPMMMGGGGKRKMPMHNRHGPRPGGGHGGGPGGPGSMQMMNTQHNCSLELRKIPRGLNEISHLNDHFSKFGKITNIQIRYDNDPEAAIVTFSSHAEANVAYRSTEAVLNNRFIKVFWHTPPAGGDQPAITASAKTEHSLRRTYPNQYSINNNLSSAGATGTTQTGPIVAGGKTLQAKDDANPLANGNENLAPQQQQQPGGPKAHGGNNANKYIGPGTGASLQGGGVGGNKGSNRAQNEMLRKRQEQFTKGINERKVFLMDGYLKEQRKLLELIVTYEVSDPRRPQLKESLDELQVKINNLRKEIEQDHQLLKANTARGPGPHGPKHKTKEQHDKEMLDAELEQIAQETRTFRTPDGPAVAAAAAATIAPGQKGPYGGGGRKGGPVGRVAPPGSTSVDRRPTTILITGFVEEEADSLLDHFKQFGEVTKHQLDKAEPSLTIGFSTRPVAEKALARGKLFNKKTLTIVWQTTVAAAAPAPSAASLAGASAGGAGTTATTADSGKEQGGRGDGNPLVHSSSGSSDGGDGASLKQHDSDGADRMGLGSGGSAADQLHSSSMETLTETDELIEMPIMVEEEEEEDDIEPERSWRR